MSHAKREPKSPYARYDKRPFSYSDHYKRWRAADTEEERQDADRKFRAAFGVPTWEVGVAQLIPEVTKSRFARVRRDNQKEPSNVQYQEA